MKRLQAYKFQLKPKFKQEQKFRSFAGSCRFVWNKALAIRKTAYEENQEKISYTTLAGFLTNWKKEEETSFLSKVHSQILQQSLKDLDRAYQNFFAKRADFPRFKKKNTHNAFRYPQGFKIDENNSRIFLPKIGWVKYRNSRNIEGIAKNVTVSLKAGKWYVSIQTERELAEPIHTSHTSLGIDLGITYFATFSDGIMIEPIHSFRKLEKKLKKLQKKLSKSVKFSSNWIKQKMKISRFHRKISNIRTDFLHKLTTTISKKHALVVIEDLKVSNMSRSASGSLEKPGKNVQAKSGLNKSILDQGWFEFRRQLAYKLEWLGGKLIAIAPQYTSQKCNCCGFTSKENRKTQALFKCISCNFQSNADHNAALNILAAGHAVLACGAERAQASATKQEPIYGVSH